MLHTFRANERFRMRIEAALSVIKRDLEAGQLATVDARALRRIESDEQRSGSKPLLTLRSEDGSTYAFKQCDAALAAAEEAAYELRRLGGRPGAPARVMSLDLDGAGALPGLLKPYIEFQVDHELEADSTTWSDEQRAVMVLEHAWEWFLDNLDTNTSQYALLGPLRLPINIDWDRAFFSEGRSEFTRFTKYKAALPNARNFLYADYVAGKTRLPLWLLSQEARRIRRLPRAAMRGILERYASVRFEDALEREHFVARMFIRQRGIEREVGNFMRELWSERRSLEAPPDSLGELLHRLRVRVWARWQHVLNAVLRGPIGTWGRRLVSFFRGRRARPALAPEGSSGSSPGSHPGHHDSSTELGPPSARSLTTPGS
jgi:hypothetical protein